MTQKKSDIFSLVERTTKRFDPIKFFTNTKFKHIFGAWIFIILLFGVMYFGLTFSDGQGITQQGLPLTKDMNGLFNSMYFSVISATATGFGDLLPHGISKFLAMLEVIIGLMIFGMLISKLVSYKQEIILEEVYEISFDEKINRLRSALYLFRSDVSRIMDKIETGILSKRKLQDVWILLISLDTTMSDIKKILCPSTKKDFTKKIDGLNLELVLNSFDLTLSKIVELMTLMNSKERDWRTGKILDVVDRIKEHGTQIYEYYKDNKQLSSKTQTKIKAINSFLIEMDRAIDGVTKV